ncbi:MAG: response regulator [Thermoleophilia bacterium]|nr:response regulator [Thermoleophilia bacterium]
MEDDPGLRELLAGVLERGEYAVESASDGLEGLRKVTDQAPDLILSDVLMPTMTGLELCALLKDSPHTSHIPFIFLTCVDDPVEGFDVGADDYLVKPFRPRELLARVRVVIRRAHSVPPELASEGLRGNLSELLLPEVLQVLHNGGASGCLTVVASDAQRRARFWLEQGELVAARLDGAEEAQGEDAFFLAFAWDDGTFAFDCTHRAESWTVQGTMEQLLLEATRRLDEAQADEVESSAGPRAPQSAAPSEVDFQALVLRIDEIRNRLKLKAYEALQEGRTLVHPGCAGEVQEPAAGVTLPEELDGLIDEMLRPE